MCIFVYFIIFLEVLPVRETKKNIYGIVCEIIAIHINFVVIIIYGIPTSEGQTTRSTRDHMDGSL